MIFKRSSFTSQKKNLNFVIFVNRKCLTEKAISLVKTKIFETLFLNIYTGVGYFILTAQQFKSQSNGRPDKR